MENNFRLWQRALDIVAPVFGPGIVAGGIIRDWVTGSPFKDVDVFVAPRVDQINVVPGWLSRLDKEHPEYVERPEVCGVWGGTFEGVEYNVIWMDPNNFATSCDWPGTTGPDAWKIVESFDFELTKCWYSVADALRFTFGSLKDFSDRTVTLVRGEKKDRSLERFHRFNERNGGDWRFVDKTNG